MEEDYFNLLKELIGDDAQIVSSLHGGMMNEAYIVSSKQGKFVFYVPTSQSNAMVDRHLEKKAQDIAESIGITRSTIYFDEKTGIKLLKFIEGDSLNHFEKFDAKKVAKLFYKLHTSKNDFAVDYNPFEKLENYLKEVRTFESEINIAVIDIYEILCNHKDELLSYPKTLCHNDGQRSNIVKDLDDNYWLIDYEFAMNNDPIYDIATFGNNVPEEGLEVLKEYEKLTFVKDGYNRYCLWRMFISIQWYLVALIKDHNGEGKIHNIDFLTVAEMFLANALHVQNMYLKY